MKAFFDTNVLVAASEQSHPFHGPAFQALKRVTAGKEDGFMSVHSIAETFAALTRMPVQPRIQPSEAALIISNNIAPNFRMVPIGKKDYLDALRVVADGGWSGAKVYDALILGCAQRSGADRIYTFNLSDFRQIAPKLEDRICAP